MAVLGYPLDMTHADTTLNFNSFNDFDAALQKAEVRVSFWGSRLVKINGQERTVDEVASALYKMIQQTPKVPQHPNNLLLPHEERNAGLSLTRQVQDLYTRTDEMVKTANVFTRLVNYIREFTFVNIFTIRFGVEENLWGLRNPFNEGITRLKNIQAKMDSPDFTSEQARSELDTYYRSILHHAIWEVAGKPEFGYERPFGREVLDTEPKGELVRKAIDLILTYPTILTYVQSYNPVAINEVFHAHREEFL